MRREGARGRARAREGAARASQYGARARQGTARARPARRRRAPVITKLKKNIPGIFQSVPYLKTIRQTSKRCTRYIPSVIFSGLEQHVPVIFRAYPCYNFFLFRGIRPANEIQQVIDLLFNICIPRHSVHQGQQDFFATGAPVGSLGSPPPRPLQPQPRPARGPPARGPPTLGAS